MVQEVEGFFCDSRVPDVERDWRSTNLEHVAEELVTAYVVCAKAYVMEV